MRLLNTVKLARRKFSLFSPLRGLRSPFSVSTSSAPYRKNHHIAFSPRPLPAEKMEDFTARVHKDIATVVGKHKNHFVFMSSPTRITRKNETLANTAKLFGAKKMAAVNLSFVDQTLFSGHCWASLTNSEGTPGATFSLRANMKDKFFYKASTAPDQRLPSHLLQEGVYVRPAMHTSFYQEINTWANSAFYISYVHHERPIYPLQCVLKPIASKEKGTYLAAVERLKAICQRYSLLDHLHPYTGETLGDIVSSENCTVISRLFETLTAHSIDLKKLLGDNPTPQLITKVVIDLLQCAPEETKEHDTMCDIQDDELSKPFRRSLL